jgi:hypothetical protein
MYDCGAAIAAPQSINCGRSAEFGDDAHAARSVRTPAAAFGVMNACIDAARSLDRGIRFPSGLPVKLPSSLLVGFDDPVSEPGYRKRMCARHDDNAVAVRDVPLKVDLIATASHNGIWRGGDVHGADLGSGRCGDAHGTQRP